MPLNSPAGLIGEYAFRKSAPFRVALGDLALLFFMVEAKGRSFAGPS
jgi:hypothetical protein